LLIFLLAQAKIYHYDLTGVKWLFGPRSLNGQVARADPLSATEDLLWRALMRIVATLSRRLDGDMLRAVGISANEYLTLTSLSEAPTGELRMTDLAGATALSASRMSRLVDELQTQGLVAKRGSAEDRRGQVASLTPAGRAKLTTASGVHVSAVRALVFDQVDPAWTIDAARALAKIAARLGDTV
jgi:DNA-binding MarR family transcriptional regulator